MSTERFWRTLEEYAHFEDFQKALKDEFARGATEEIVPGKPLFFATAFPLNGYGLGILAESHMGRPTKIEGNSDHPASRGSTDAFAQASVLSLYDPDRSKAITEGGRITTWDAFITTLA